MDETIDGEVSGYVIAFPLRDLGRSPFGAVLQDDVEDLMEESVSQLGGSESPDPGEAIGQGHVVIVDTDTHGLCTVIGEFLEED